MTITVTALLHAVSKRLYPVYSQYNAAYNNAWLILEHVTGQTKEQLLIMRNIFLTEANQEKLESVFDMLLSKEMPLIYALGSVPFLGLNLSVKPPVLIPRPETEEWCSLVIQRIAPFVDRAEDANGDGPFTVLDLCTGSGCIGLAIASHFKNVKVFAIDNATHALDLACYNAHKNNIANCSFISSDLYKSLPINFKCDLIVANPPYIKPYEFSLLDHSVIRWEDRNALVAHDDGFAVIKSIIQNAPAYLTSRYGCGQLWCEIGSSQGVAAQQLCNPYFDAVDIIQDINKKDRVLWAQIIT